MLLRADLCVSAPQRRSLLPPTLSLVPASVKLIAVSPVPKKKKPSEHLRSVWPLLQELVAAPEASWAGLPADGDQPRLRHGAAKPPARFSFDNVIEQASDQLARAAGSARFWLATMIQGYFVHAHATAFQGRGSGSSRNCAAACREHVGRLPIAYYDANKSGVLVSRIMNDVEGIRNLIGTGSGRFAGGILTAILSLWRVLLWISSLLTGLALLPTSWSSLFWLQEGLHQRSAPSFFRLSAPGPMRMFPGCLTDRCRAFASSRATTPKPRKAARLLQKRAASGRQLLAASHRHVADESLRHRPHRPRRRASSCTWARSRSRRHPPLGDLNHVRYVHGFSWSRLFSRWSSIGTQVTEVGRSGSPSEVLGERPEDEDARPYIQAIGPIQRPCRLRARRLRLRPGQAHPARRQLRNLSPEPSPRSSARRALESPRSSASSPPSTNPAAAHPRGWHRPFDLRLDAYRTKLGVVLQDTFLFDGTHPRKRRASLASTLPKSRFLKLAASRAWTNSPSVREGVRHHRRRARRQTFGWTAPARLHRARHTGRPPHPNSGRSHFQSRFRIRSRPSRKALLIR